MYKAITTNLLDSGKEYEVTSVAIIDGKYTAHTLLEDEGDYDCEVKSEEVYYCLFDMLRAEGATQFHVDNYDGNGTRQMILGFPENF